MISDRLDVGGPGQVLNARFADFDQLAETIKGWDLDWRQLDAGPLQVSLLQVQVGPVQVGHFTFTRQFLQRGSSPPGIRTLGLIGQRDPGVRWCGYGATGGDILVFDPSGDYQALSQPGFEANTFSFPEEHLVRTGEGLGHSDIDQLLGRREAVVSCDAGAMARLRTRLTRICQTVTAQPSAVATKGLRHELEVELPAAMLQTLASGRTKSHQPGSRARTQAVKRAQAFIEANQNEALTVQQVCQVAGVSWRTLDYAFREHFGVPPKRYLQAVRLNGVRRELRSGGNRAAVTDVANQWGFWHMGQFAADYRRMFGELPSETQRRRSQATGAPDA